MIALSVATIAIIYNFVWIQLIAMKWGIRPGFERGYLPSVRGALYQFEQASALSVAAAWLTLALTGG